MTETVPKTHRKLVLTLVGVVIAMFAFGYALVPIYNSLCKALGINGKTNTTAIAYDPTKARVDESRWVTVEFIATNNTASGWSFYPKTRKLKVHPGEMKRVSFFAKNGSDHTMIVQAIPSITPGIGAKYFQKTECFCFTQQTLASQEAMDMPLLFHIDTELPKHVKTLTLSYTLFDVTARMQQETG